MNDSSYSKFFPLVLAAIITSAQAGITTFAEYHLGEDGSFLPIKDSSGNDYHYTSVSGNENLIAATEGVTAIASTSYIQSGNGGYFNGPFADLTTDNFAVGIYVRAAAKPEIQTHVLTLGRFEGALRISLNVSGWEATIEQGEDEFMVPIPNVVIGTPAAFAADAWVHLAVIRHNGETTFYLDGVAQGDAETLTIPVHSNLGHLTINPGGAASFTGDIDEMRVLTFTPEETSADIMTALLGIDSDGDGLFDDFEQRIIDADAGDLITSLADVLPGDNFDGDDLTNLGEQQGVTDPADPLDPPAPPTDEFALLAFWDFDDNSDTAAAVDLIAGYSGVLQGAVYTENLGGRSGNAGDFGLDFGVSAANQNMVVESQEFLDAINATTGDDRMAVSFWQKNTATGNSTSFWFDTIDSVRGMQAHLPWGNGNIFYDHRINNTATNYNRLTGAAPGDLVWTEWNHFLFIKEGTRKELWINGVQGLTNTAPGFTTAISALYLGSYPSGANSLQGVLDDFAIFNKAPSEEKIASLAAGVSPLELVGGAPDPLEITKIRQEGDLVTLIWNSNELATYAVKYSFDMIDWGADLDDSVAADPGSETSFQFNLSTYGLQNEDVLFFRVEKQ